MRRPPILFCKNCNKQRAYRQHLYIFLTMRKHAYHENTRNSYF